MIVDTHVHIVAADQHRYPRQLGHAGISSWVHDLPVEEMLRHMNEAGIDRAVLSQAFGVMLRQLPCQGQAARMMTRASG